MAQILNRQLTQDNGLLQRELDDLRGCTWCSSSQIPATGLVGMLDAVGWGKGSPTGECQAKGCS